MPGSHRFRDEWLVALLKDRPDIAPARIDAWRKEKAPFLSQRLLDASCLTFDQLARLIRDAFRIDATDLSEGIAETVSRLLPEQIARRHFVLPVHADQRDVDLAMANPLDEDALRDVGAVTGRRVNPLFAAPAVLERISLKEQAPDTVIYDLLRKFEEDTAVEVVEREDETVLPAESDRPRAPIVQLANNIIGNAVRMNASDIHIEHDERTTTVRYRVDGLLRNALALPRYVGAGPLVSRIKIMAGLDVSDRLRPQDGRAKLRVGGDLIGLRVSTLPARTGEKAVLRILNEKTVQATLGDLGWHPEALRRFAAMLAREQGIVLVTGPTGSGKTTTLYAALNHLHGETVNVVTVEDPIEYRLADITQVQVNERQGLTFPAVLRSVLRQDPDIVMLGEIRDGETAQIAVQAALTGHLVLSTLHTNDTVGAVVRLADLGIEPFKIASAVAGVTAQRLVRRLCPACAGPADPANLPSDARAAMQRLYGKAVARRAGGCEKCGFSGYQGRLPLIELLDIGEGVREAIAKGAEDAGLRREATAGGALHTMEADALWHVLEGHTSWEQVQPFVVLERLAHGERAVPQPPRAAAPAAAVPAPAPAVAPAVPAAAKARVLVATADPVWRAVLEGALGQSETVAASFAATGSDALASIAKVQPEVLVITPDLPVLSGEQVIRGMRSIIKALDVTTIVLLPEEDPAAAAAFVAAGADEVVAPPVTGEDLQIRIAALLARRRGWSAPADVARPPVPVREAERQAALDRTGLLDTPPEERFDKITRDLMTRLDVPIALLSLVDRDRQWFKSKQGISATQTERAISFCGHAINYDDVFVVEDAFLDPRFSENPLVTGEPHVRFYAGAQVRSPEGHAIGMLCVNDHDPRSLTDDERQALVGLARKVETELAR